MRKQLLLSALFLTVTSLQAEVILTQPGELDTHISNKAIEELTVQGAINAADMRYITDSLSDLKRLDLREVHIQGIASNAITYFDIEKSLPAKAIPSGAFFGSKIQEITLPNEVNYIGIGAFGNCKNLTTVVLPESLQVIDDYAFAGSAVKQIELPSMLHRIGKGSFQNCSTLQSIDFGQGNVTLKLEDEAFRGCISLTSLTLSPRIDSIGDLTFKGCTTLASLTIAEGAKVTHIGKEAFAHTALAQADLSLATQLQTIGQWCFENSSISSLKLPNQLKIIPTGLGYWASNLRSVTLPTQLEHIGDYAFAGNTSLTELPTIPIHTDSIGNYAFFNDSLITSATFPASVNYIGTQAMAGNIALKEVVSQSETPPALGDDVWAGVDVANTSLSVPFSHIGIYQQTSQWQDFHIMRHYLMGDVNDNGVVDIVDLSATLAHINGTAEAGATFLIPAADFDNDHVITLADVDSVAHYALKNTNRVITAINTQNTGNTTLYPQGTAQLKINDITLVDTDPYQAQILYSNAEAHNALQVDMILPTDIQLEANSIVSTERTKDMHILQQLEPTTNTLRLIFYPTTANGTLLAGDSAIVKFSIKSTTEEPLVSKITLSNGLYGVNGIGATIPMSQAVINHTSGVEDVVASNLNAKVYSRTGEIIIDVDDQTTAIVVKADGTYRNIELQAGTNHISATTGVYIVRLANNSYKLVVQ